jgi:hypothetical protein
VVGGLIRCGHHAFTSGAEVAGRSGVLAPNFCSGDQALVVAVKNPLDGRGQQFTAGLLGLEVHGVGPVVIGRDVAKVMRG